MGNYKDGKMEKISNAGNGNYFYIDNVQESKKVFVTEMRANLFTIAKDVKIQIEFNPQKVKGYRLLGYENRRLNNEDFDDDTKDAGELGAGHSVTAVYEIIPVGSASIQMVSNTNEFKFESADFRKSTFASNELMNVRLRYKPIKSSTSVLLEQKLTDNPQKFTASSEDFRFSAAVTGFGLLLRNSQYKGKANYAQIVKMAKSALGKDPEGHRAEFVRLVEQAALLK
jgi:Ca-activated chloride channel family protein